MPHLQETLAQKQAGLKAAQDQLAEVVAKVRPDASFSLFRRRPDSLFVR